MAEISMAENLCSICSNTIKKPKILRCRHVFCKKCLGKQKTGCIHCPVCNQDTTLLKEGVKTTPPCDKCEATSSQFICQDCEEYLCQVCRSGHEDIKMCKNHDILGWDKRKKAEGRKKKKGKEQTTHEKTFCPCDGKRKVGYLCLDCSELICYKCYINDHTKHENLDLREDKVNKQIHSDLSSLQDRIKVHSEKLLKFFEVLMEKKTEVNKMVNLLKDQIDQQVEDICNEVRKTGETMKTDIEQIYYPDQIYAEKNGSVNLSTLLEDIKQDKQKMATFLKKAATDLKEKCTIPMWSRLDQFRKEEEKLLSRKMQVPDLPATQYKPLEVNKELLAAQFGEMVTHNGIFEHTFRLDEIGTDKNYSSPMISCMSRAWSVNMWQWFNNEVCLGLQLNETEDTSNESCKFNYTLTIANEKDDELSLVKHGADTFTPGDNPSRYLFIPKRRLTDPTQGFATDGKFRIKVNLNNYVENTDEKKDSDEQIQGSNQEHIENHINGHISVENTDEKEDIDEQIQGSNQEHIENHINGHIYSTDDENSDTEHSNIFFL